MRAGDDDDDDDGGRGRGRAPRVGCPTNVRGRSKTDGIPFLQIVQNPHLR